MRSPPRAQCPKYLKIFKNDLTEERGPLQWRSNLIDLFKNTQKFQSDVAIWKESYGLWPGQAFALFAGYSRWVHLSTNTLPFYNVFPRLQGQFPGNLNFMGYDESPQSMLCLRDIF